MSGGVDKEEFVALFSGIHRENRALLEVFFQLAGIMFFLLYIVSMLSNGFAAVNSSTYLIGGIVMLAIMLCVNHVVPKHPAPVMKYLEEQNENLLWKGARRCGRDARCRGVLLSTAAV